MTTDTIWTLPYPLNWDGGTVPIGSTMVEATIGDPSSAYFIEAGGNQTTAQPPAPSAIYGYIGDLPGTPVTETTYAFLDGAQFNTSFVLADGQSIEAALLAAYVLGNEAQTTINDAAVEQGYFSYINHPSIMATQGDPYGVTFNSSGQLVVADQNGLAPSQEPVTPPPPVHGHEGHEHNQAQIATVLAHWACIALVLVLGLISKTAIAQEHDDSYYYGQTQQQIQGEYYQQHQHDFLRQYEDKPSRQQQWLGGDQGGYHTNRSIGNLGR